MCVLTPSTDPTAEGVWWRDDSEWRVYPKALSDKIIKGLAERLVMSSRVDLGDIVSPAHPTGASYVVDLVSMTQMNVSSGERRAIKVVEKAKCEANGRAIKVEHRDTIGIVRAYDGQLGVALLKKAVKDHEMESNGCS